MNETHRSKPSGYIPDANSPMRISIKESTSNRYKHMLIRRKKQRIRRILALFFTAAMLIAVGVFIFRVINTNKMRETVEVDTFYPGIMVDGEDLSKMTYSEAMDKWFIFDAEKRAVFGITLIAGESTLDIDAAIAAASLNYIDVLNTAFALGREGSLEDRYAFVNQLKDEGVSLETNIEYDVEAVRNAITQFSNLFYVQKQDAYIKEFDFKEKKFSVAKEQGGLIPNTAEAIDKVIALLNSGEYGTSLSLSFAEDPAELRRSELTPTLGLMAKFSTDTTDNADRNANIKLSSHAISGTVLQPGDTFSFNEATGERSSEKGYKEAGAIRGGTMILEPGGGVCQVSSTLFNAVVRAGLDITDRSPHSWPMFYAPIGEDAAVNFPDKDFQFRNNTSQPLYIWMRYSESNQRLSVEIYGVMMHEDNRIELETKHLGYKIPDAPIIEVNKDLEQGEVRLIREERLGQSALTYKLVYHGDELVSREELHESHYLAIQGKYEVGPNTDFIPERPQPE